MTELVFSVDSALLSELGEKLVGSVHVALLELIKNSYDADATEVLVGIYPEAVDGGEIVISDNGSGMTFNEVKAYWMRIATTNKVDNDRSKIFGRPKSGAKGIGRFSCRRLGRHLTLSTTAKLSDGRFQRTVMTINWDKFVRGTLLEEIKSEVEVEVIDNAETGTQLILRNNSASFTKRNYDYIKRHLAILVANRGIHRDGYTPDPGFELILETPDGGGRLINLRDQMVNAGWGTVDAKINKKGQIICSLDAMGIGKRKVTSSFILEHLSGVNLKFGVLVDSKDQVRDPSVLSLGVLREVLAEWGGIYVRYKGVRVQPYGEHGDDWLGIDKERGLRKGKSSEQDLIELAKSLEGVSGNRHLLNMLSSRSYVGDVLIEKSSGFELKASREGFLESSSFRELQRFVRFAVDTATIYREIAILKQREKELSAAREEFSRIVAEPEKLDGTEIPAAREAVEYIKKEFQRIVHLAPPKERKVIERKFELATDLLNKHEDYTENELNHLRLVASTSTLLLIFSHDVRSFLSELDDIEMALDDLGKKNPVVEKELSNVTTQLEGYKNRFLQLVDMTSIISRVDSVKADKHRLSFKPRLETAKNCFELMAKKYEIEINLDEVPEIFHVGPISEAELYAMMINIISNAVKAVVAQGGIDKTIKFSTETVGDKKKIIIQDNGLGVDIESSRDLFSAFVSDPSGELYTNLEKKLNPEDSMFVGEGSGLGLSIVKGIIDRRSGSIKFESPDEGMRTKLVIEF